MVNNLVKCLPSIKAQYELKGLDFESDYVALYTEARETMTALMKRKTLALKSWKKWEIKLIPQQMQGFDN